MFSASEQTYCSIIVCDSEWVTVSTEVVTAPFSCYLAGAT